MKNLSKKIIAGMIIAATMAVTTVAMAATSTALAGNNNGTTNEQGIPGRGIHRGMVAGKITAISGSTITLTTTPPPAPPAQNVQATGTTTGTTTTGTTTSSTTTQTPPAFVAKTFTINASSATIKVDGEDGTLSSLAVGDQIIVKGTASTTDASQITAKVIDKMTDAIKNRVHYRILGQITAISGNNLTVKDSNGTSYTVDSTSANIIVNGTKSTVSNLAVGDQIMAGGFAKDSTTTTIKAGNIFKGTAKMDKTTMQNLKGQGFGNGMEMDFGPGFNPDFGPDFNPGMGRGPGRGFGKMMNQPTIGSTTTPPTTTSN